MKAYERLLDYVVFNTRSDSTTGKTPSTPGQLEFGKALMKELSDMGISDAVMDDYGYIYGSIPANCDAKAPAIGLIAHMDTADNLPGPEKTPKIIKNYDGKAFKLEDGTIMDPEKDKNLKAAKGCDIIVTNGKTLLGGDDKAGLAAIMTALEYFVQHPEKKHGKIAFSFTPDEEIGESQDHFNVEKFGADYAFTLDGEKCSEMSYENFNACSVKVTIKGFDVHPGNAKDVMINAADIGTEFNAMLPQWRKPCHTERYDGFFHLDDMSGNIENCVMDYLIREFDSDEFAAMKETMKENAAILNKRYGEGTVTVEITDSYRNMFDVIKDHMDIIEGTVSSIVKACGSYEVAPSRGGTDGAGLSFKGVPCPNLGTGSFNHHSTMEFANAQQMDKLVDVVVDILEI